jgi:formylglycine-generating enzyme required for sulfatase activity
MYFVFSIIAASLFTGTVNAESECQPFLRPIHFNFVRPGTVASRPSGALLRVEQAFELGDVPVTQEAWFYVMGNETPQTPLRPAFRITQEQAQQFVDRLNALSAAGDPGLARLIDGYQRFDRYRLPTDEEWTLVATRAFEESRREEHPSEIDDVAWTRDNSGRSPHDVASKEPLYLDGQPFYDLLGNVPELVQNGISRGGSVEDSGNPEEFLAQRAHQPRYLGLRLVRIYLKGQPLILR